MTVAPESTIAHHPNNGRSTRSSRRNRPTTTNADQATSMEASTTTIIISNSTSVAHAKTKFVASVSRGISVLMEVRGFSRERATAALLREIGRGDSTTSSSNPPNDQEMFDFMSHHGLGLDGASKALAVSKAVQRVMHEQKLSMVEAIDSLTSKLSVTNLIESRSALSVDDSTDASPNTADMRIQLPILAQQPRSKAITTTTTTQPSSVVVAAASASVSTSSTTSTRKTKTAHNKQKNTNGGSTARKRSVEEMKSDKNNDDNAQTQQPTRKRADSLSEVVNAKFGGKDAAPVGGSEAAVPAPAAVVRVKRSRQADESEASSSSSGNKRSRAASSGGL